MQPPEYIQGAVFFTLKNVWAGKKGPFYGTLQIHEKQTRIQFHFSFFLIVRLVWDKWNNIFIIEFKKTTLFLNFLPVPLFTGIKKPKFPY